ncbi:isopentenyl-diphosphate delta-isomerase, partial [Escherichia coli]|nr:isopentenyl-diphosphate delta-isomerase [Escherichia coli]EFN9003078.1 isopentenyl-diphosphate delta-isomerase [Escherichia coli]
NPDICRGCEHNVMLILPDASPGTE